MYTNYALGSNSPEYGVFSSQTTKDPLKHSLPNAGARLIRFQTRMNDKLDDKCKLHIAM